jgi:hypothetical protein
MKRLLLFLFLSVACRKEEMKPEPPKSHVEIKVAAPFVEVTQQIRDARADARLHGRSLVVYIGATWCEPCQRFHKAAAHGDLDKDFPSLTLLEYDLDTDGARLKQAGYAPEFIPYFGKPGDDGRASDKAFEGSVKGDGAVGNITPRLKQLVE